MWSWKVRILIHTVADLAPGVLDSASSQYRFTSCRVGGFSLSKRKSTASVLRKLQCRKHFSLNRELPKLRGRRCNPSLFTWVLRGILLCWWHVHPVLLKVTFVVCYITLRIGVNPCALRYGVKLHRVHLSGACSHGSEANYLTGSVGK